MKESRLPQVIPAQGLHVLHLFYRVDFTGWSMLSAEEKMEARTRMLGLFREIEETPSTQLHTFSMLTPKADLGFMLLTPDLQDANAFEKRLALSLGPDILTPSFGYLSMTETSEYTTTEEEYSVTLETEEKLTRGTKEFDAKLEEFRQRMKKYGEHRLYPTLPDWPVFCFYPMSKRRGSEYNWYALPFEERKKLMAGHARVGRTYSGKILQLITGSTGLDDHEWGVSLFAHDTSDVKSIVYEMRFDEVSSRYAEFGEFFIGLQLSIDEIFSRHQL